MKRIDCKPNQGTLALYSAVFLLVGVALSIFLFFPQFLNMQSGIYQISCNEIVQQIQSAVYEHDINVTPGIVDISKPVDLDTLVERGYLAKINTCPQGGVYMFDDSDRVYCTIHSATGNNQ